MKQTKDAVCMTDISKAFGGVQALKKASFCARAGEVHALMGENGAGKSTLMKILAGAYAKDQGDIRIFGEPVQISSPRDSRELGISIIYQEFALAPHLSVAENIFIDHLGDGSGIMRWDKLYRQTADLLGSLGFGNIDPKAEVGTLSVAYQQVVEICKALSRNARILVFDEPTAVLASSEVRQLFDLIRMLRQQGTCIIYISHRLEEIFTICDRITVMKDGSNVGTVNTGDIDQHRLVQMMIGRELSEFFPPRNAEIGDVVLEVKNIRNGEKVKGVSFQVHSGEILGINGLVGAGRTETMRLIFGADIPQEGEIRYRGMPVKITGPRSAVRAGIGMLQEDRKGCGVLLDLPVRDNITISALHKVAGRGGWINRKEEERQIQELVESLRIKAGSIEDPVSTLSGGNQQKVSLAKWLYRDCGVLILDEPTRGVDVGAKVEIYKIMNELAEKGVAIIMISSEMPEIIGMSDRVLIMREGMVSGELKREELTETNMIHLAMGVK